MTWDLMGGRIDGAIVLAVDAGSDLKSTIEEAAQRENITSGVVISGIGTLEKVVLRNPKTGSMPPEISIMRMDGPVELLSLEGNISMGVPEEPGAQAKEAINVHLHAMVSDKEGRVFGGSVASGNIVWRQVELVIAKIGGVALRREREARTKLTKLVLKKATD